MQKTQIEAPATEEVQTQMLVEQICSLKEKLFLNKEILKEWKVNSDRLKQFKQARKEMNEQIAEEKRKIEDEFLADKDFEQAKNDSLNLKNDLKEKTDMLKVALGSKHKVTSLFTEDRLVKGEQIKLQLQFSPHIFLNGKEVK